MRRHIVFACVVLAAISAGAQNLTEKIDVSLVNVDVTVTSKGSPARGLTQDDFEILEDGVPQAISHFYAIENAREKIATAAPIVEGAEVTPPPVDERFRRKVLIVIDNRHMSIHGRDVALRKLEQFINDHFADGAYDWSIAMISDRVHLLLPLTSDKALIHGALGEIRAIAAGRTLRDTYMLENRTAPVIHDDAVETLKLGNANGGTLDKLIAQSNRMQAASDAATTYAGIIEATSAFANASGRKIVLLMTGGFDPQEDLLRSADPSLSSKQNAGVRTLSSWLVREANTSDVSVSVINTEGLVPTNLGPDVTMFDAPDFNGSAFASSALGSAGGIGSAGAFFWIARQTGGQSFNGNFVDRSLGDFDRASSNFYSLAYRPSHAEDNRYHRVTVRLKKGGPLTLSYRTGYGSIAVDRQLDRVMRSAMAAGMMTSTMALNLTTGTATKGDMAGTVMVPLYTSVSSKALQFLPTGSDSVARVDIFVSVFSESGNLIRTFRTMREARTKSGTENEGNFVEEHALRLRTGTPYRIVVAVHDQVTDAVGIKSEIVRF